MSHPDHKTQRYDRQWRLWGDAGQQAIESANICLINGDATGTETLKNLILPGVGKWTVIDGANVTPRDLGNNFFVDKDHLGKSRAQCTVSLLQELNPEFTQGFAVVDQNGEAYKSQHWSLVIASNMPFHKTIPIAKHCAAHNIPFLIVRSYGFIGYLRLQLGDYTVIESKPDIVVEDLRINKPFPELLNYVNKFDIANLSDEDFTHIPYVVILIQLLNKWKAEHNGSIPSSDEDKAAFKDSIKKMRRTFKENNFDQALEKAFMCFQNYNIPFATRKVLNDPKCVNIDKQASHFWIIAHAVQTFYSREGALPLLGRIPDMAASSMNYIELQNIYRQKSNDDFNKVKEIVRETLGKLGRNDVINDSMIELFCKNNLDVRAMQYRTMEQEFSKDQNNGALIASCMEDPLNVHVFYILLRAIDKFHEAYGKYPSDMDDDVETLKNLVGAVLNDLNIPSVNVPDEYIAEMVRYGGSELHNIASFMGGVASQEAIKVITRQLIPVNNTFVFCGIISTSTSFEA